MFVLAYSEPESANRNADRMDLLTNIRKKKIAAVNLASGALGKTDLAEYSSNLFIVLAPPKKKFAPNTTVNAKL